jgi:hypothetical protein
VIGTFLAYFGGVEASRLLNKKSLQQRETSRTADFSVLTLSFLFPSVHEVEDCCSYKNDDDR